MMAWKIQIILSPQVLITRKLSRYSGQIAPFKLS
jgi:hypothetical protein